MSSDVTLESINDDSSWGSWDDLLDSVATGAFQIASYLTDPVCKCHELFRRIDIVDALHPQSYAILNLVRKVTLVAGIFGISSLALLGLPAIFLRLFAASIQKQPFIYVQGGSEEKELPQDRSFTLLSWNICCIGAGYPITNGGVMPWTFRIDRIVNEIIKKDADVNCLYETFDVKSAFYISEQLKQHGYQHFHFNIGPQAVGISTGILVASKYKITNPEFTPFSEDSLVGRTKNVSKGFFAFDLVSQNESFARVYATHLQHSEEPDFPTHEEIEARKKQMQLIVDKVKNIKDRCVVVTGDLNLDDKEYNASTWHEQFQKGDAFKGLRTWGGDTFCAKYMGNRTSEPLNLDHTMILNQTAHSIQTTLVQTGFDAAVFKEEALSDHEGLFSHIILHV